MASRNNNVQANGRVSNVLRVKPERKSYIRNIVMISVQFLWLGPSYNRRYATEDWKIHNVIGMDTRTSQISVQMQHAHFHVQIFNLIPYNKSIKKNFNNTQCIWPWFPRIFKIKETRQLHGFTKTMTMTVQVGSLTTSSPTLPLVMRMTITFSRWSLHNGAILHFLRGTTLIINHAFTLFTHK